MNLYEPIYDRIGEPTLTKKELRKLKKTINQDKNQKITIMTLMIINLLLQIALLIILIIK